MKKRTRDSETFGQVKKKCLYTPYFRNRQKFAQFFSRFRFLIDLFENQDNIELINRLKSSGIQFEQQEVAGSTERLKDIRFVVSGVFKEFSRDDLKALIELNGGKNVSSVSSKTNFIVAGDGMGPSKKEKAEKLGVKIITEKEFKSLINLT